MWKGTLFLLKRVFVELIKDLEMRSCWISFREDPRTKEKWLPEREDGAGGGAHADKTSMLCAHQGRDWGDVAPRTAGHHQKLEEARRVLSQSLPEEVGPRQHFQSHERAHLCCPMSLSSW